MEEVAVRGVHLEHVEAGDTHTRLRTVTSRRVIGVKR